VQFCGEFVTQFCPKRAFPVQVVIDRCPDTDNLYSYFKSRQKDTSPNGRVLSALAASCKG